MKTLTQDFTTGSVSRQLLLFATPLFLSSLLQIVYNIADMIIVGQVSGSTGLSAVAIGGDITNFITFLAMGFGNAGQVIIAQYLGANQSHKISRFVGTLFSFLMSTALILSLICFAFRHTFLIWMNTPIESFIQAKQYLSISLLGLIFVFGYNIISTVLRGLGDSKHPFIFISIASILNILLDIFLVAGLKMNAAGAALATVISQGISFFIGALFIYKHQKSLYLQFSLRFFRIEKTMLWQLLALGIPMAIKGASIHISKLFLNSWINSFGVAVSAVSGIAHKLDSISNLVSNSVNTAGSSMVGQNIGAQKYTRVPLIMKTAFGITCVFSSILSLLLILFPEQIFGFFTSEQPVIKIAMEYLPIAVLYFFGSAFRAAMNSLINGSGNYIINFITALFDGIIARIGLALVFGLVLKMGYKGLWLGDALAGFTPFFVGIIYFYSGTWKTRKYIIKGN